MDDLPTILIHLDNPDTGELSFKLKGVKGARWRKARSIYEVSDMANEVAIPAPRILEYVLRRD